MLCLECKTPHEGKSTANMREWKTAKTEASKEHICNDQAHSSTAWLNNAT